jgi:hypothetical protein
MDSSIYQNIILNKFFKEGETKIIKEISPSFKDTPPYVLGLDSGYNLYWFPYRTIKEGNGIIISPLKEGELEIDISVFIPQPTEFIKDDKISNTEIYWKNGRLGIGRSPLLSYIFDISVSENLLSTALHIGDGKSGFSMGNGTNNGFLPEIIGMGKDEMDAGLYFLGRAGNNISSNIPLVIIDGRSHEDTSIANRPIFGITNANYHKYHLIVDYNGNVGIGKFPEIYRLDVDGDIHANDLIINGSSIKKLISIIDENNKEISNLKKQIGLLIDKNNTKQKL